MNQMEIFKNPEFGSIRTFEQDGKVLFCGKDVAQALGYRRPADAIAAHCKGVCVLPTPSNGGIQQMKFIPEGDVYRLIVHSKLPSAERFERWVFDEVLPSIRQHGAYLTREKLWEVATSPEALLKLCSDLLAEREKNAALREDNARLQGKAVYGINALSNNLIMVDRKLLKNPNGLILGTPGSGKSFSAKREIANCFLLTSDDVIICDPEAEYAPLVERLHGQVIRISPTSSNYITVDMIMFCGFTSR